MSGCILFFVKYPEPGEVKTRLAEEATPELAAEFYKVFVQEKLAELEAGCDHDIIVFFTPEQNGKAMPDWLGPDYRYLAQKGAELGRRMENAFREAFFMGYERVILAGSDIPGLTPAILDDGLAALTPETASIGPADDGGYYCIGFHKKGFSPKVFSNMQWSNDDVFQRTVNRLSDMGMEVVELARLEDTDTIEDVETLVALGTAGPLGGKALAAARKLAGM